MNEEIIELQNKIKSIENETYSLTYVEWKEILDYITNLQEENERLKELCDKYEEEHSTAFKLWKMKMEEMPTYEEKEDYKSRIDKAIEYINEMCLCSDGYANYGDDLRPEHIVDILQGEDKE